VALVTISAVVMHLLPTHILSAPTMALLTMDLPLMRPILLSAVVNKVAVTHPNALHLPHLPMNLGRTSLQMMTTFPSDLSSRVH
jgi:hypothetical protein